MVANTETENECATVIAGNERVLRARLADARFFWDQDRRRTAGRACTATRGCRLPRPPRLHVGEGEAHRERWRASLFIAIRDAKPDWIRSTNRNRALDASPDKAARAGKLCKADLVTEMVGEFPDLQGTMGAYYAQADGEAEAVYEAIAAHYEPQGPNDQCPAEPVSVAVALADKLDTLAGFFAIDERPTGSKDPFALRRTALGAIRLIMENGLRLPLGNAFKEALEGYGELLPPEPGVEATKDTLLDFFADRLRAALREKGVRHDLVSAVFGAGGEDDLMRLSARVVALAHFLEGDDGANLLTAYRRAANILRIEEKKDGQRYDGEAVEALFVESQERLLNELIAEARADADAALRQESFGIVMAAMATLRLPVDAFFDHVTVNCEDPALRRNRLLMLSQIRSTLDRVADFSKIEG